MTARVWRRIGIGGGAVLLALVAGVTVASWQAPPPAPGCSSCDARHQRLAVLRAAMLAEAPEPVATAEMSP